MPLGLQNVNRLSQQACGAVRGIYGECSKSGIPGGILLIQPKELKVQNR